MAFPLQSEIYLASYVVWKSPEDVERRIGWLEGALADRDSDRVFVGYLGDSENRSHWLGD